MEGLIEELEDMAKSERRQLESRLKVLLVHLLTWQYQPDRRGRSLRLALKEQRLMVQDILEDNPSLEPQFVALGEKAYRRAVISAARETDREENAFPATFEDTGWTWAQVLDGGFYPD